MSKSRSPRRPGSRPRLYYRSCSCRRVRQLKKARIDSACWMIFANLRICLKINFVHFFFPDQVLMDIIQDAVHELAALRGAVILGEIDIFIDGHLRGNGLEIQEL